MRGRCKIMRMNSKNLSEIKNKLKSILKDKRVIDVVVFGSAVKGKIIPRDIDIAVISDEIFREDISGFHVSSIKPRDFFHNPPTIATTLLKEGYSLKENKPLSEILRYKSKILIIYNISKLNGNEKVR